MITVIVQMILCLFLLNVYLIRAEVKITPTTSQESLAFSAAKTL